MSPAGHWPELRAAVEAGADAVYFGLTHFTARAKVGFGLEELPAVVDHLHTRGVRGYVTLNTLVFDHELQLLAQMIAAVAEAGIDAVIIQDPAVARLARQIAPALELHGSTQMSITSVEGIELAREQYGVSRVVLARELSLEQIGAIAAATDVELEMFVHGALCVSYSGQCFSSEAWGGRSANRGQCAQACRLPYELLVDGDLRPLGDARYLLSPQDLYALDLIPEIVELGVTSLKIEGRYKGPEYVALTTQAYRQAVDAAAAGARRPVAPETRLALEQVYSRGLAPHFLSGTDHQAVVDGRSPRHRGVDVGRVVRVEAEAIVVRPHTGVQRQAPLKPGDGVVFDAAHWRSPQEEEEGGRLYAVKPVHDGLELRFRRRAIDPRRIRVGDWLWRTGDVETERRARPFTQGTGQARPQQVSVQVTAHVGAPLRTRWSLRAKPQCVVELTTDAPLEAARERGVDVSFLRQQLGRLGGTAYELADLELDMQGNPFVPASLLGPLRRDAVETLTSLQKQSPARGGEDPLHSVQTALQAATRQTVAATQIPAKLHLLVRTPEQLTAALDLQPASITLDYLDLYGLRPAIEQVRASGIQVRVASPRILKPGEEGIVRLMRTLDCPLLVRSGGLLRSLTEQGDTSHPLIGDFSLNAANTITADQLLQLGLSRLTPTHDLNAAQVARLAQAIGGERIEAIAYGHMPVFHTEHCVFCRFLSDGTSYRDCGRPCETHQIALRDSSGRAHPVLADVGCRNTVFGVEAQQAGAHLASWRDAGIHHFRLEFAHESAAQVTGVTQAFVDLLAGRLQPVQLATRLRHLEVGGVTEGSLFIPVDDLALPEL